MVRKVLAAADLASAFFSILNDCPLLRHFFPTWRPSWHRALCWNGRFCHVHLAPRYGATASGGRRARRSPGRANAARLLPRH
eukprot:9192817-Pyramimonas_sp.AAC.1